MRRWGSFGNRLAAIAAGALALRVIYTVAFAREHNGRVRGDLTWYHEVANHLADGRGIINPRAFAETGEVIASAEHPPLWSGLLAIASLAGLDSELAHRLVGTLVGTAVVVCVGLLARGVSGDAAGVAAAAIAAVYPVFLAADGSLMSETLYGLIVAVALLLAYALADRPTFVRAAALGGVIGLSALTRGEGILLLALLVVPVLWRARPGWLAGVGVAVAACLLVIAPWTIRNYDKFGELVAISTNDGTVMLGANCDRTYGGRDIGFWTDACFSRVQYPRDEARQSRRWRSEGIDYARDHIDELPVVIGVRLLRTLGVYQPRAQLDFAEGRNRRLELAGQLAFLVALVPLAIYGGALLRRRGEPLAILLAPVALVVLMAVATYGYTRFRHAAEIPLVVLAGVAAAELVRRATSARRGW